MDIAYPLSPIVAWLAAGSLKFAINTLRQGSPAFGRIGLGGAVSTHTTIVWTISWLVGLRLGFGTPEFGIALTLAVIVMIDALDLRQKIGAQVAALKALHPDRAEVAGLRERMGHRPVEVVSGIALAFVCAVVLSFV